MSEPSEPLDFRAALLGSVPPQEEDAAVVRDAVLYTSGEEQPAQAEEEAFRLAAQGRPEGTAPHGGGGPLTIDPATGLISILNGSRHGSVTVDPRTEHVVIDPAGTEVDVDEGTGRITLRTGGSDVPTESSAVLERDAPAEPPVVAERVRVQTPAEGDVSSPPDGSGDTVFARLNEDARVRTEASVPAEHLAALRPTVPAEPAVARSESPMAAGTESEGDGRTEGDDRNGEDSESDGSATVTIDPETGSITVLTQTPDEESDDTPEVEESPEEGTESEGSAEITVDPETGVITIEAGDLRIEIDPQTDTITVDPGDGVVGIDPETGVITIEEPVGDPTGDESDPAHAGDGTPGGESPSDGDRDRPGEDDRSANHPDGRPEPWSPGSSDPTGRQPAQTPAPFQPGQPLTPVQPSQPATGHEAVKSTEEDPASGSGDDALPGSDISLAPVESVPVTEGPVGSGPRNEPAPEPASTPTPVESVPVTAGPVSSGGGGTGEEPVAHESGGGDRTGERTEVPHFAATTDGPDDPLVGGALEDDQQFHRLEPTTLNPSGVTTGPWPAQGAGNPPVQSDGSGEEDEGEGNGGGDEENEEEPGNGGDEEAEEGEGENEGSGDPEGDGEDSGNTEGDDGAPGDGEGGGEGTEDDEGGNGGGNGDGTGGGGDDVTAIDFERVKQFHKDFLLPLQERVSQEVTRFSAYAGEPEGHFILIGNGAHLPISDTLATEIDTSLTTLHGIMADLESELIVVSDRLHENLNVFINLEDDQDLTAQELLSILGEPSVSAGSGGGGSGNPYGGPVPDEDEDTGEDGDED
ncbi:hypothetical protein [Nocardiopsis sp. YSL2]|uniref:hypothetical protein n=1 Tax=Nocardiopsis sp. YSL2 TaxID=2939492 RepID=UPI0026F426ED|nr:hypothetical protein [Nocardiopsis sp. YSL2]